MFEKTFDYNVKFEFKKTNYSVLFFEESEMDAK